MELFKKKESTISISLIKDNVNLDKGIKLDFNNLNCLKKEFKPLPCSNLLDNDFWKTNLSKFENLNFDEYEKLENQNILQNKELISSIPGNFEDMKEFKIKNLEFFSVQNNDTNKREFELSKIKLSNCEHSNPIFNNCKLEFKSEPNNIITIEGFLDRKIISFELKRIIDELIDESCKIKLFLLFR